MREPHIFADNPLNRGEVERRDEEWINVQAADARSKFLPFRNLNVLLTNDATPELGWLLTEPGPAAAPRRRVDISRDAGRRLPFRGGLVPARGHRYRGRGCHGLAF